MDFRDWLGCTPIASLRASLRASVSVGAIASVIVVRS